MEVVGLCALIALAAGGCPCPQLVGQHDENPKVTATPVSTAFDSALEATGADYLRRELDLRQTAPVDPALDARLQQAAAHGDPHARLLARVVLDWGGAKRSDFEAALAYLDELPLKLARTAMGKPSPTGTESYLTLHFSDRVADLLALRLIKGEQWPDWKSRAVIFYLTAHRLPSATPALLRFAIETPDEESRELALDGVRAIADRDLDAQVTAELARAQRLRRPVPAAVRALAH